MAWGSRPASKKRAGHESVRRRGRRRMAEAHESPLAQFKIEGILRVISAADLSFELPAAMMVFRRAGLHGACWWRGGLQHWSQTAQSVGGGFPMNSSPAWCARIAAPKAWKSFPLGLLDLHVRAVQQFPGHDPLHLHRHQPHHRHLRAGADGVLDRDSDRLRAARFHFFSFFLPEGHPLAMAPMVVALEILSTSSGDQPVDPAFRQYDGRPHHAQSHRRLRHHARRVRRAALRRQCSP